MELCPYLGFNGNCREAFTFYERCLRGKIEMIQTWGESPMKDQTPPEALNRIMHVRLAVGDKVLMGSDGPSSPNFTPPHGMHVTIGAISVEEGQRIFNELAEGGKVEMPFQKTFWAAGFGMLVDRFGTPWMVNCEEGSRA